MFVAKVANSRFLRGLGANGFAQVVQLIIRFSEIPIFISLWGIKGYGDWLLITAVTGFLILSDCGVVKSGVREIVMRHAANDFCGANKVYEVCCTLVCIVLPVIILSIVLVGHVIGVSKLLGIQTVGQNTLTVVFLLLGAQIVVGLFSSLLRAPLNAEGKYALGEVLQNITSLLSFVLSVGVALLGGGVLAVSCALLVGGVLGGAAIYFTVVNSGAGFRFALGMLKKKDVLFLIRPSTATTLSALAETISIHGVRILVGVLLGAAELAVFSTIRTLCRMALQPITAVVRTLEPAISMAHGAQDTPQVKKYMLFGSAISFWLSIPLCAFMLIFSDAIFGYLIKGEAILNTSVFYVMLACSFVASFWSVGYIVPVAMNRHLRVSIIFFVIQGCVSVLLTLLLGRAFGILGVSLALLIVELLTCAVIISMVSSMVGVGLREWFNSVVQPVSLVNKFYR